MQLDIDHGDERGYARARAKLLDRFAGWLAGDDRGSDEMIDELVRDAGVAVDWKWNDGNGARAMWRTRDVTKFLLGLCPRKLIVT